VRGNCGGDDALPERLTLQKRRKRFGHHRRVFHQHRVRKAGDDDSFDVPNPLAQAHQRTAVALFTSNVDDRLRNLGARGSIEAPVDHSLHFGLEHRVDVAHGLIWAAGHA